MRAVRRCAVLCALIAGLSPAAADAADVVCAPAGPARATVLYFHPGGFVEGSPSDPINVGFCKELAARGYRTRVVEYPLMDLPGAVRAARRSAARRRERTFAVGGSAGGTLAALLSVRGRVDGAVTFAAPTDLLTWPRDPDRRRAIGTRRERRAASPYHRVSGRSAPLLLLHDPADQVVPFDQAQRLARRDPHARLVRVDADYRSHTWRPEHRRMIIAWLDARTR